MGDSDDEGEASYQVIFDDDPSKAWPYLPTIDGSAKATYPNKDTFVGAFKDGKRTGPGCYTFASGSKYEGDYFENKKHGNGVFVAPDGGKYVGEWAEDKRHGKGTYSYPTGDRYDGLWANGAKHGKGTYYYANIGSSITGVWSNGQCVDGVWNIHEGSSYTGSFLGNQPAGDGLFKYANGNTQSGRFVDRKFVSEVFTKPHPNEKPPRVVQADPFKQATRIVDKAVMKVDHSKSMHSLKMEIPGVANFRRVGNTPIYGCGQPSLDAFRRLNDHLSEAGFEKVISANLRQDPVVYVSQLPFTARDRKSLDTSVVFPESLTLENIKELEDRMADNTRFAAKRKGALHQYFEEIYSTPEKPFEHTNEQKTLAVADPSEIRSISAMYEFLAEEDVPLEYSRVPIPEHGPPSLASVEAISALVRNADGGCLLFNDQLGIGRVTTASTIATLLTKEVVEEEEAADEEEDEEAAAARAAAKGPKVPPTYDEHEPDLGKGQYSVMMTLVKKINGPTKQELEMMRVEEKEQREADKVAKTKAAEEEKVAAAKAVAEEKAAEAAEEGAADAEAAEPAADDAAEAAPEEAAEGEEGDGEKAGEAEEGDPDLLDTPTEEKFVSSIPTEPSTLGDELKMVLDDAIDKNTPVLNLRTCIVDLKKKHDASSDDAAKAALKSQAQDNVLRYCHLLIFAMYAKEQEAAGETAYETTYVKWAAGKPELFDLLGTKEEGLLANFKWT